VNIHKTTLLLGISGHNRVFTLSDETTAIIHKKNTTIPMDSYDYIPLNNNKI
jgi:hypothetical protein